MVWNALGFILRRFEKRLKDGDLFLLYLIWYPLGRFFIEFLRTDSWFSQAHHLMLSISYLLLLLSAQQQFCLFAIVANL